jgi:hypothetical protein
MHLLDHKALLRQIHELKTSGRLFENQQQQVQKQPLTRLITSKRCSHHQKR